MRNLIFITLFVVCLFTFQVSGQKCGKKTKGTMTKSSASKEMSVEPVKSIKGKFLLPDGEVAENIIVELFRNTLTVPTEKANYIQRNEIFKQKRLEARYAETNGKFCFKNLKAGNYALRANFQENEQLRFSHLSTIYLYITVDPKVKNDKNKDLELTFDLAI